MYTPYDRHKRDIQPPPTSYPEGLRKRPGWDLWVGWALNTSIGPTLVVLLAIASNISLLSVEQPPSKPYNTSPPETALLICIVWTLGGVVTGLAQWLILRFYLQGLKWWEW